jgi:integrase
MARRATLRLRTEPAMPKPRPPYLQRQVTRHGTTVWYVRQRPHPRIRIPGDYGSPQFMAAYQAAIAGTTPPAPSAPRPHSVAWLVARYRDSMAWSALSLATRRQREAYLAALVKKVGQHPLTEITRAAVVAGRDQRRDRPNAARHVIATLRGMFKWALEAGLAVSDPTQGVAIPRQTVEGFAVWPAEWRAAFEARWPLGTRQRLAYEVLLQTGLRRGDAVRLGRPHLQGDLATLRTEKTGESVSILINARLREAIQRGPCGDLTFIAGVRGRPMDKASFGTWFRGACRAAGVPGSAHGLRKARATELAERGASEHELDALFGWKDGKMARHYTRNANRLKLAVGLLERTEPKANIYALTGREGEGSSAKPHDKSST